MVHVYYLFIQLYIYFNVLDLCNYSHIEALYNQGYWIFIECIVMSNGNCHNSLFETNNNIISPL